jgi:hypothetical protein
MILVADLRSASRLDYFSHRGNFRILRIPGLISLTFTTLRLRSHFNVHPDMRNPAIFGSKHFALNRFGISADTQCKNVVQPLLLPTVLGNEIMPAFTIGILLGGFSIECRCALHSCGQCSESIGFTGRWRIGIKHYCTHGAGIESRHHQGA